MIQGHCSAGRAKIFGSQACSLSKDETRTHRTAKTLQMTGKIIGISFTLVYRPYIVSEKIGLGMNRENLLMKCIWYLCR
jgi:hypothetical protein